VSGAGETACAPGADDAGGQDAAAGHSRRREGLAYARASGLGLACFLIAWAPFSVMRWGALEAPGVSQALAIVGLCYGMLLFLPFGRMPPRVWRVAWGVSCVLATGFVFLMVNDAIFLYMLAIDTGTRPGPPAFQSLLVFLGLLQPPTLLFQRKPHLLD